MHFRLNRKNEVRESKPCIYLLNRWGDFFLNYCKCHKYKFKTTIN